MILAESYGTNVGVFSISDSPTLIIDIVGKVVANYVSREYTCSENKATLMPVKF